MEPVLTQVIQGLTRVDCVSLLLVLHRLAQNENTYSVDFFLAVLCAHSPFVRAKNPAHFQPPPPACSPLPRLCLLIPLESPRPLFFGRSDDPH